MPPRGGPRRRGAPLTRAGASPREPKFAAHEVPGTFGPGES